MSMFTYNPKKIAEREKAQESFAAQCYPELVSSSFLYKVASFHSFFLLSPCSPRLCSRCAYVTCVVTSACVTVSVTCPARAYKAFVT